MKKSLLFLAASALALSACTDALNEAALDEHLVSLTISTEKPEAVDTRTMVAEDGKTPMWCPGDAIGVSVLSGGSYTNHEFTSDCLEASKTTTFTGKTAVGNLIYTYYPYSSAGVTSEGKAMVTIPAIQNPASTSFDGAADILVGKPVSMNPETTKIEGLQFKRVGGFLKIVINDQSGLLADETFYKISVTAENNLAGDIYLDIVNGQLGEIYGNGSTKVTAKYETGNKGIAWLGIYPQTLTEGSTIMIAATTDSYYITRKISLPYDIEIKEGQITTLNIKITAENISEKGLDIEETFPDPNFRKYVSDNFDIDHNGKLSKEECAMVMYISVSHNSEDLNDPSKTIKTLEGVQYFTNLTQLFCQCNLLTTLDLSKNTALTRLDCAWNQLMTLDISNNTELTFLRCGSNSLTTLDVSKNTALTTLSCNPNQLTTLDVSNNTALTSLDCCGNQLTALDVSKNTALTYLNCFDNQLTSLDVSKNTALTELWCHSNQLATLDVNGCVALETLSCDDNQLTTLEVSENTALKDLSCYNNRLTTLDVSNNTALKDLSCCDNQLTTLDLSNNTALESLACWSNQLTILDVSNTNLGNSTNPYPLYCAPMETLKTLYLKTGWEINDVTTNRNAAYIPEQTEIVFVSGDYGESGDAGDEIGDGGDHDL